MKLQVELWGHDGKNVGAVCRFEADVEWVALDLKDIEKMQGFEPDSISSWQVGFNGTQIRWPHYGPEGVGVFTLRVRG